MINKYFKVWWILTTKAAQIALESRFGSTMFILGKILRFAFLLIFIVIVATGAETIAGYDTWQVILFFATFNLIDSVPQFFFREVYRFRLYVVSGDFDYFLVKPLSPLFRSLFGGADILDSFTIIIAVVLLIVATSNINGVTVVGISIYIILIINAFLITTALHIFVLALGVITTEIDSALWIYKDLTAMGRFPIDIYKEPLRGFITFVVPIGIMISFPPMALLGFLSAQIILFAMAVGISIFLLSLKVWKFALRKYSSASS